VSAVIDERRVVGRDEDVEVESLADEDGMDVSDVVDSVDDVWNLS
jgi:hypothetical protein